MSHEFSPYSQEKRTRTVKGPINRNPCALCQSKKVKCTVVEPDQCQTCLKIGKKCEPGRKRDPRRRNPLVLLPTYLGCAPTGALSGPRGDSGPSLNVSAHLGYSHTLNGGTNGCDAYQFMPAVQQRPSFHGDKTHESFNAVLPLVGASSPHQPRSQSEPRRGITSAARAQDPSIVYSQNEAAYAYREIDDSWEAVRSEQSCLPFIDAANGLQEVPIRYSFTLQAGLQARGDLSGNPVPVSNPVGLYADFWPAAWHLSPPPVPNDHPAPTNFDPHNEPRATSSPTTHETRKFQLGSEYGHRVDIEGYLISGDSFHGYHNNEI